MADCGSWVELSASLSSECVVFSYNDSEALSDYQGGEKKSVSWWSFLTATRTNVCFLPTVSLQGTISKNNSNAEVCLYANIMESVYVSAEWNASWTGRTEMALQDSN